MLSESKTEKSTLPSRRTVIEAAAWTAPVVALAVATPAEASSRPIGTLTGQGCMVLGWASFTHEWYYETFTITLPAPTTQAIVFDLSSFTSDSRGKFLFLESMRPFSPTIKKVTIPKGKKSVSFVVEYERPYSSRGADLKIFATSSRGSLEAKTKI